MIWYDLFICLCFETRCSYVAQVDLPDSSSQALVSQAYVAMSDSPVINRKKKKDPGKQGLLVLLWGQGLLKDTQVLVLESVMIPCKVEGV